MPDLFPAFAVALTDHLVGMKLFVRAEPVVAGRRRVVAEGDDGLRLTFDFRRRGNEYRVDVTSNRDLDDERRTDVIDAATWSLVGVDDAGCGVFGEPAPARHWVIRGTRHPTYWRVEVQ